MVSGNSFTAANLAILLRFRAYLRLNSKIGKHRGSHIAHSFERWPAMIWHVNRGLSRVIHSHVTIIGAGTTLEVDFLELRVG